MLPRTLPNQMVEFTACCNTGQLNRYRERLLLSAFENAEGLEEITERFDLKGFTIEEA